MMRVKIRAAELFHPFAPELEQLITPDGDLRTLPSDFAHEQPRLAGLDGFYAAVLVRAS